MNRVAINDLPANGKENKLLIEDRAVHEWYRFVLSFPDLLQRRLDALLDVGLV